MPASRSKKHGITGDTRICAELKAVVAAAQPLDLLNGSVAVEDAPLAALGLVQGQPLLHEAAHLGLLSVSHAVVGQLQVRLGLAPVATLSVAHAQVAEVGQADLCAAPTS